MNSKKIKMQRKLKRKKDKEKMISELRMASLGFVSWENQMTLENFQTPETIAINERARQLSEAGRKTFEHNKGFEGIQIKFGAVEIPERILSELHKPVQFGKTEAFKEVIKALGCDKEISYVDMIKMNNKTYEDSLTTFRESVAKLESIIEFPKVVE